jgi:hypothetical protein
MKINFYKPEPSQVSKYQPEHCSLLKFLLILLDDLQMGRGFEEIQGKVMPP